MSHLFSPQQLADYLGVPIRTVYAWNSQGTGPTPIKVGKHVRYRAEDVEAFLDANANGARTVGGNTDAVA